MIQYAKTKFEIEIGIIRYSGKVEFTYKEGKWALDPRDETQTEMLGWELDFPVMAWDMEEEIEYKVDSDNEFEMVQTWLPIDELFEKALSR